MKINNIPLALSWFSPWLFIPILLITKFNEIKFDRKKITYTLFFIFFFGLSSLSLLNYVYLVNIILLFFLLFHGKNLLHQHQNSYLLNYGILYIFFGTLFGIWLSFGSNFRVGLYGGEVNFSGFTLLTIFCLALALKKYQLICLIFIFINLYIGSSRTLLLMTLITFYYYYFRNFKVLLFLTTFMIFMFVSNGLAVLAYLLENNLITNSGYLEDASRLLIIADSSTDKRLEISELWFSQWTSSLKSFLFGVANYDQVLDIIQFQPHSSFIQKGAQYGAIYLLLFIYLVYKFLPIWFGSVVLIYGFFLHNLWSVPIIIFLSYILGKQRS